jgi:outer membrane protein TolC
MTASIEEEISEVRIEEMKQELKNQLAQEYELYNVRRQLLEVAQENMKAAELNLNLSHEKYQNGSINSFNFRDVQNIYLNTAYQYQNAIFSVIQSYNNLLRLTGGLLD